MRILIEEDGQVSLQLILLQVWGVYDGNVSDGQVTQISSLLLSLVELFCFRDDEETISEISEERCLTDLFGNPCNRPSLAWSSLEMFMLVRFKRTSYSLLLPPSIDKYLGEFFLIQT